MLKNHPSAHASRSRCQPHRKRESRLHVIGLGDLEQIIDLRLRTTAAPSFYENRKRVPEKGYSKRGERFRTFLNATD